MAESGDCDPRRALVLVEAGIVLLKNASDDIVRLHRFDSAAGRSAVIRLGLVCAFRLLPPLRVRLALLPRLAILLELDLFEGASECTLVDRVLLLRDPQERVIVGDVDGDVAKGEDDLADVGRLLHSDNVLQTLVKRRVALGVLLAAVDSGLVGAKADTGSVDEVVREGGVCATVISVRRTDGRCSVATHQTGSPSGGS